MASSSLGNPGGTVKTSKRLGELLQEQQEPFLLDVYLLERGYPSTRRKGRGRHCSATSTTGCYPCPCPRNISNKNLNRFPSGGDGLKFNSPTRLVRNLSISQQMHPRVPTTQRNINKLLSVSTSHHRTTESHHHLRACHSDGRIGVPPPPALEGTTHRPPAAELDRVSSDSSSSSTVLDSCSDRDRQLVSASLSVSPSPLQQDHIPSSSAHNSQAFEFWNLNQQEIASDKDCQWGCFEDCNKQWSPVSMLEQVSVPSPVSSLHIHLVNRQKPKTTVGTLCPIRTRRRRTITRCTLRKEDEKEETASTPIPNQSNNVRVTTTEDSIFSASLWEMLLQRSLAQKNGSGGVEAIVKEFLGSEGLDSSSSSSSDSQYVRTKRVLQQTRQLLFDCVREAVKKYRSTGTGRRRRRRRWDNGGVDEFIGPEELGKIICDKIHAWGKQSVGISNFNQVVEADISEEEEWSGCSQLLCSIRNEIGMGIADALLEEMSNEIIGDMIHIHMNLLIQYPYYQTK